jgi:hypothetical protein
MCSCDGGEPPRVYSAKRLKARKQHRCCECRENILVGETYELASGLYDSSWSNFKTCNQCLAVRERAIVEIPDFCIYHGGLHDELFDCGAEADDDDRARGRYCSLEVSEDFPWLIRVCGHYRVRPEEAVAC